MSGLLAEVRAKTATDPRRRCGIADFIANLDDVDKADLDVALADETIRSSAIHAALEGRGMTLRSDAVRRHRRGDCACGPR